MLADHSALDTLRKRQSLIRDRIRGVVHQAANGVYLHGRAGVSKTYMVRTTLESLCQRYAYSNGHLTPVGLFELIETNPHSVIVLDDVTTIFGVPKALQLLLAALGTPHDGSRTRTVRYKTATTDKVAYFEGSIIAISNLSLGEHSNQVLQALQDRVHVMAYEPTDDEVEAQREPSGGTATRLSDAPGGNPPGHALHYGCSSSRASRQPAVSAQRTAADSRIAMRLHSG